MAKDITERKMQEKALHKEQREKTLKGTTVECGPNRSRTEAPLSSLPFRKNRLTATATHFYRLAGPQLTILSILVPSA